jgi:hypothetical protein
MKLRGRGKGKENDRKSTTSKYIAYVQVDDITIRTKGLLIIEDMR